MQSAAPISSAQKSLSSKLPTMTKRRSFLETVRKIRSDQMNGSITNLFFNKASEDKGRKVSFDSTPNDLSADSGIQDPNDKQVRPLSKSPDPARPAMPMRLTRR